MSVTAAHNLVSQTFSNDKRYSLFKDHQKEEKQYENCIFEGDNRLQYIAFNTGSRAIKEVTDGNYCKLLFDLAHDLNVARNRCDFGAQKVIAQKVLDLLKGNYTPNGGGAALVEVKCPPSGSALLSEYLELRLFVDLLLVQAAQALYAVAIQEQTTLVMKTFMTGKGNQDIRKSRKEKDEVKDRIKGRCLQDDYEIMAKAQNVVGLDAPVNRFLSDTTKQAKNKMSVNLGAIFSCKNPVIEKKCMFAVLLMNPIHIVEIAKIAIRRLDLDETFSKTRPVYPGEEEEAYRSAIREYTGATFKLPKKDGLSADIETMIYAYFMRCFSLSMKVASLNEKEASMPRMKLMDRNGTDIFGNSNTCTFNSSFGCFEKNKGNEHLVSVGGVFSKEQQKNLYTEVVTEVAHGKEHTVSIVKSVPCRIYKTKGLKYEMKQPSPEDFYNDPNICLNLFPMNDLSSRPRVRLASSVYMTNQNASILKNGQLLNSAAKEQLMIERSKEFDKKMLSSPLSVDSHTFLPTSRISEQNAPKSREVIALVMLVGYYPSELIQNVRYYPKYRLNIEAPVDARTKQRGYEQIFNGYLQMYAPFEINVLKYGIDPGAGAMARLRPQRFFNELSIVDSEGPMQSLLLQFGYIVNPFAPMRVVGGFNKHARPARLTGAPSMF